MKRRWAGLWIVLLLIVSYVVGVNLGEFLFYTRNGMGWTWTRLNIMLAGFILMIPLVLYRKSRPSLKGGMKLLLLGLFFAGAATFAIITLFDMLSG